MNNFDEILKAKRGKGATIGKQPKNNIAYKKSGGDYSNNKNQHHIMTKITGGAKDSSMIKNHLDYISRNGELKLYDDSGIEVSKDDASDHLIDNANSVKWRKDAKKTYQVMFSRKGKTSEEDFKNIVRETVSNQFPNHDFYYALHDDTDNTHVHVVISKIDKNFKNRLDLNKKKLNNLKSEFANTLNKHGYKADYFISESERKRVRESYLSEYDKLKLAAERKEKRARNLHLKVVDYGNAPYKFRENSASSFYLVTETSNGKLKEYWSKGLKDVIVNSDIKKGDMITIKKINNDEQLIDKFAHSLWEIEKHKQAEMIVEEYTIKDFGSAPYKFDSKGKPSFFVAMESSKGETLDYWAKSLEQQINSKDIKRGDKVSFLSDNLSITKIKEKEKVIKKKGLKH